ncbi:hypothetical protein ES703_71551 [subsurface metagenome]
MVAEAGPVFLQDLAPVPGLSEPLIAKYVARGKAEGGGAGHPVGQHEIIYLHAQGDIGVVVLRCKTNFAGIDSCPSPAWDFYADPERLILIRLQVDRAL